MSGANLQHDERVRDSAAEFGKLVSCLIDFGFVVADDWVAWAVDELVLADGAPSWLAELTTTYSVAEAQKLLASVSGSPGVADVLGCLWLALEKHCIDLEQLLERGLEAAGGWDTGGGFIPYQRELMDLMRHFEDPPPPGVDLWTRWDQLDAEASALFAPLGERVRNRAEGRLRMSGL